MRHAAAWAGRDQRFHADIFGTGGNGGPHHRRDQRVFVCAAVNRRHARAHARVYIARCDGDFFHLRRRFHGAQRLDDACSIGNGAEPGLQGFIDGNRQEPAALVQSNPFVEPAALLQHAHQKIHRVIAILVDGGVRNKGVGDKVKVFELANHKHRIPFYRQQQRLEGVIAWCLLTGEPENVFRAGNDHDVHARAA